MLRKLFACLALLTGLTAAGVPAPAEAAVLLTMTVEAAATNEAASRNCNRGADAPQPRAVRLVRSASIPRLTARTIFRVPSFYLGCDRARE